MQRAELNDLMLEWWLRNRNSGELKWQKKDGELIAIKDMTDEHLLNTINMLIRREADEQEYEELKGEYDAWLYDKWTN